MFQNQPKPFLMIFLLEVWERFGFYTVQGILTLYFIRFLNLDNVNAYYAFGAFSALVYTMVPFGGYIGDNILGPKRTVLLGLITLACGYLFLALAQKEYVFHALGLICVGNGIFKTNPSNLLAKCYEENDKRLHSGFTLYYMAVNLGSIFALFLGPEISTRYGYSYAYFLSFIGIMLGLFNYWFQRKHLNSIKTLTDERIIKIWQWILIIIFIIFASIISAYLIQNIQLTISLMLIVLIIVLIIYFSYMKKSTKYIRMRMGLALILMIEGLVFFILYYQMPTSLNLFAVHNVHPYLLGIHINSQSFQALNPIWIIILSPLLAMFYQKLNDKGIKFSISKKFALGMTLSAISFSSLFFARFVHNDLGIVSSWWLVISYLLQSASELLVSALGVAMVAELMPREFTGFVMGFWFLTTAIAGILGGYVASFTSLPENITPGVESLMIYTKVFGYIGLITFGVAVLLWLISPLLNRMGNI